MKENEMRNPKITIYSIANKHKKSYVADYTTMAQAKNALPEGRDWSIVTRQVSVNYANSFCLDIVTNIAPVI